MVNRHAFTAFAQNELIRHGLSARGWTFRFNTNKRRLGVCKYTKRRVEISVHVLEQGEAALKNVLAHEIAHALVGHGHGHNHVWRAKAIELGCDGQRCGVMKVAPTFVGTCRSCNGKVYRHRRRSNVACSPCLSRGVPFAAAAIVWSLAA